MYDLNQEEQAWIRRRIKKQKYKKMFEALEDLHIYHKHLQENIEQVKADVVIIKDLTAQLAQIILDAPTTTMPSSESMQPDTYNQINTMNICNEINSMITNWSMA